MRAFARAGAISRQAGEDDIADQHQHQCVSSVNRGAAVAYGERRGMEVSMLYTLAIILLIAWLLGIVGTYTIGAFVHVLLIIALVLFIVGILNGRRTVV